jgi:glycosyltransferase involved in cell wall biosynthesis
MRIILGIGPSTDGTEALAERLAADSDDLTVVPNPSGKTPSALNAAIQVGSAPVVVRVDGHSLLSDGYITQAVETLRRTGAANVGGMQVPMPSTPFESAVAAATTSVLGTGGVSYRTGGVEASVDTVYLGVFDRAAIEAVGLFDESLIRNQDYELNIRLRNVGCDVVFDPVLSVGYRPRHGWGALARQYFEYGTWKAIVLRKHPKSLRVRQLIPAAATGVIAVSLLGSLRKPRLVLVPVTYLGILFSWVSGSALSRARISALLATMHLAWGVGLLQSFGAQLNRGVAGRCRSR